MRNGKNNPNYKGGKLVKCKVCGKEVWDQTKNIKRKEKSILLNLVGIVLFFGIMKLMKI